MDKDIFGPIQISTARLADCVNAPETRIEHASAFLNNQDDDDDDLLCGGDNFRACEGRTAGAACAKSSASRRDATDGDSQIKILNNSSLIDMLTEMLKVDTNYNEEAVNVARSSLITCLEKMYREKYSFMGMVSLLSTCEALVDRLRVKTMVRDVFFSLLSQVIYRAMNMDPTVEGCRRMRTYSCRGNVVIDTRLYPYDNITETTGVAYVSEDDLDSRFANRVAVIYAGKYASDYKPVLINTCLKKIKEFKVANKTGVSNLHNDDGIGANEHTVRSMAEKRRRRLAAVDMNNTIDF